jgi:hypothetical protein
MLKKDKDRYGMQEGGAKPDFLDLDGDGNKEESMKKAAEDKKDMREPKVFGGLARQAARLLSKSRRRNVKPENLTEADILDYNKLVPDDDKILIGDSPQLLNIADEPIFPNFIDDLDNPVTVKDAKLKLKQYEELVEEMKKEPGLLVGGRGLYELQEAENIVDALERDIQKSIAREPKADGGLEGKKVASVEFEGVADTYKIKNPNDKLAGYDGPRTNKIINPNDFTAVKYVQSKFFATKDLKEEMSGIRKEFNKAFREARNEGLETFMFRGDEYHTRLKEEMEEMREPKVLGGLARGISKQLQKFISSSKSGMKTIQEGMQEPISPNELADVLEYNKLVSNPQDKIFYKKSDADYSSFFRNYIDGENSVITIKDAKQVLKESKKDLKQKRKEANTGQEMDELEMFENMVSDLEIDIRMIELDEPSIDKARGLLSEGGNVDKEMEQLRNMYEEGGEMKMLPDEQMEEQFVDFVIDEALSDKEESMLMEQLEANPELSMIFDKVIEKASEFTGAGEVEGPGTGTSDSIPARLSDGEFVFTAKSVEQIGADNLMKMMKDAEAAYDAGEDREKMQEGGLQEMSMDMERDMPNKKEVEVTYNVNRPETVSTVQPLLAREQEEDLITQKLKEDMLGPSKMR